MVHRAAYNHLTYMEIALSILFGGLITVLTAIGVEYLRRPKLRLSIEEKPCDVTNGEGSPARNSRFVRLKLRNEPLWRWARWMERATALGCHGEITFHHLDGQKVFFGRAMAVRWSGLPVAQAIVSLEDGKIHSQIIDVDRPNTAPRIDVYAGEEEILDVAVRFDDEPECYGWNNDGYSHKWRNPNWKLPRGRYLVKVVIASSGQKCTGLYRLVNNVDNRTDFRLEAALAEDWKKVR
jgi:hypothetical protein